MNSVNHEPDGKWKFDETVANVFDDMLERSIPDYCMMRNLVSELTCKYAADDTAILDLGCSTGGAIKKSVKQLPENHFIGIEVSEPMREIAENNFKNNENVTILNTDINKSLPTTNKDISVILSILTIQFTPIEHRLNIIKRIYDALSKDGAFIFVEKVLGNTADLDNLFVDLYYKMKGNNGYTHEKIQKKRKSLEGVLVPVTSKWNYELLKKSGFKQVDLFWRNLNFAGYIAVK